MVSMKSTRSQGKVLHTQYNNSLDINIVGSLQLIDDSWATKMLVFHKKLNDLDEWNICCIQKGLITGR